MTPEAARDRKLGVKMQTLIVIKDSLRIKKSKNWESFLQNVHLWPHVPL